MQYYYYYMPASTQGSLGESGVCKTMNGAIVLRMGLALKRRLKNSQIINCNKPGFEET